MALRFLNSGYFAGKVGIGTDSPTSTLTVSSSVGADGSWNKSGILIENTSTTTGEPTLAFRNAGTAGTGANYWHTGLNQSNLYKIAYGTSFTDGNTKFELATNGALRLNSYTQGFLQTDANGNVSLSGGGTLPGGPYVTINTDQSITSTKTFDANQIFANNIELRWLDSEATERTVLELDSNDDLYLGKSGGGKLFLVNGASYTTAVTIDDAQNVGIGTTDPTERLAVQSSFANTASNSFIEINSGHEASGGSDLTGEAGVLFKQAGSGNVLRNAGSIVSGRESNYSTDNKGDSYLSINTAVNSVNTEKIRITSGGNVGIGTASPGDKLEITGSTATAGDTTLHLKVPVGNITAGVTEMGKILFSSSDASAGGTGAVAKISTIAGDGTNAWIGSGRPTDLAFFTQPLGASAGLVEAMRIDQDGNVGIGTDDPNRTLHVYGQFALSNADNSGSFLMIPSAGTNKIYSREADNVTSSTPLSVVMDSNEVFHITTNGAVGIRNADPVEELDVRSTSFSTAAVSTDRNTATENIGSFAFYGRNDAATPERLTYARIMSSMPSVTDGSESGDIFFQQIDNGTVGETVRILSSGNVGIGTDNPAAPLQVGALATPVFAHVAGISQIVGPNYDISDLQMGTLNLTSTTRSNTAPFNQGNGPSITFSQNGSGYVNGYEKVIGGIKTELRDATNLDYASDMKFYTHNNTALSERMKIDANGNVGINTSGLTDEAPDLLTISGDAKYIAHYDGTNYAFKLGADSSGDGNFQLYNSSGDVRVKLYGELNADNYINNGGNFGIGETVPLAKLHVKEEDTLGIKTVYGSAIIEATDAQLDLLSTSAGTWGSAINFVESDGVDANTDVWSIARQTTGGTGDSRLSFNFGTNNQHQNTAQVIFASDGEITSNHATISTDGSSTLTTKGYVDSLITGATIYRGAWDPSGGGYGSPDLSGVTQTSGYYYICSADGTAEPNGTGCEPDSWQTGDWVIYNADIVDCAGTGTGGWQKIDNSSVLSGIGTGTKIAKWAGANTVNDSDTLENSIISDNTDHAFVDGGVKANYFQTAAANTDYNLISRDSAGNSPLYVQAATSDTNQWIAKFNHGSAIANGGTNVLTVGKDISYFNDTKLGIGTESPGTINGVAFTGVGLHVASTGIGRTITSGATWAEYILNDEGAATDQHAKFMEANQGVLSFGSYDDDGTQRTAVEIKNNGQLKTLYNLVVGDGTKTGGDNMYIQMGQGLDVYVNREFDFDPENSNGSAILLLCAYAPYNNMNGSVQMDRTSGLRHSCRADIVISAGSGTNPIGVMKAMGLAGAGEPSYRLVKFNKVDDTTVYIGLEITNPDGYYENTGAYFNGRVTSTGDSLVSVKIGTATGQAENITAFEENGIHDFHGDVEIEGNLAVSGQVDGDLTIADDLTVGDQLTVGGVTTLNDPLTVNVDLATAYTTTGYNDVGIVLNNKNDDNVTGMYSTVVLAASGWEGTSTGVVQLNAIQEGSNRSDGTFTIKVRDDGTHYEAFRIKYNGNVGIGTDDPAAKLTIKGSDSLNAFKITDSGDGDGFKVTSHTTQGTYAQIYNSDHTQTIMLDGRSDSTARHTYFNGGGNVGIGITAPIAKLHVYQNDTADDTTAGITIEQDGTGDAALSFLLSGTKRWRMGIDNSDADKFKISTSTNLATDNKVTIDVDGRVGIGDTGPSSILSISDSVSTAITMKSSYDYSQNRDWQIVQNNFGLGNWGGFAIKQSTAQQGIPSVHRFGIDRAGNVGIGIDASNTAVYSKLQVEGGIKMGDDTDAATVNKVGTMRYRTGTEYVDVTGAELVTNGNFATDTNWTKGTGVTIASGVGTWTNTANNVGLTQLITFTANAYYRCNVTVSNYSSGSFRFRYPGISSPRITANGTYSLIIEANQATNDALYLQGETNGDTNVNFSIDNVSVVEVTAEEASYADMCMQTGASEYEWVNIVRNTY